jgi:MFS family permease
MRPAEQSEIPPPEAVCYKEPGLFYGWYIVAAGFVSLWIHAGIGFYSFPVFFVEFFEQLGWKRGETATGFSIAFIVGGLTSPIVGRLIPRYGPKIVVVAGALIMSASFVLFSLMQTLWQYYLICFLLAVGWCCTGAIATSFAVSDWFNKKRGTAMGVMMVGVGLGGLVCVPLTRLLVNQFEWRATFGIYAVSIVVLLVPVAAAILKQRPSEVLPDGEAMPAGGSLAGPEDSAAGMAEVDWTFRDAARTTAFWIISAAFILAIFGQTAILLNQVAYFQDIGISPERAAGALGLCAFLGVAGKLFFGAMADRYPARYAMALCFGLQAAGTVVLILTPMLGSPIWFVLLWGFAMGGVIALQPLIVAECFGMKSFGVILGMIYVFTTIGGSFGAPFAGFVHDANESYSLAFGSFVATYALAACLSFLAVPPKPRLSLR